MGLCQRPCYSAIRIGRKTHLAAPAAFRGIHAHSADRSALAGSQGTSLRGTVGAGQLQTTPLSPFRRMRIEHFQRRDDRTSRCTIGNRSVRCQATSRQGQRPTKRCPFAFLSAIPSYSWLLHRAIEERHDLGSRAVVAGAEQTIADTTGNAVLLRPSNRRRIVGVRGHVQEGGITAHGRAAVGAPQEGDRLRSRAVAVGVEGHSAGAAGEALLNRP